MDHPRLLGHPGVALRLPCRVPVHALVPKCCAGACCFLLFRCRRADGIHGCLSVHHHPLPLYASFATNLSSFCPHGPAPPHAVKIVISARLLLFPARKAKNAIHPVIFMATLEQQREKGHTLRQASQGLFHKIQHRDPVQPFFSKPWSNSQPLRALGPLAGFFSFSERRLFAFVPTKTVPPSICSAKTPTSIVNDPKKPRVTSCHPSFSGKDSAPLAQQRKK